MSCRGLKLKRQENTILSQPQPLEHGLKQIKLEVRNSNLEDINTGLKNQIITKQKTQQSSMPESLVLNKLKTSEDRNNILSQNIQEQNLSQILVQDLITKEPRLEPFFNPSLKEISKKLWLPIKTDLQELTLNSLNGFSINSGRSLKALTLKNSQRELVMNSLMTSCQLLPSLLPDTTEVESIKKPRVFKKGITTEEKKALTKKVILRAHKFKINFEDNKAKAFFELCFEAYNTFYNLTIREINKRYEAKKLEFNNHKTCIHKDCLLEKVDKKWFCTKHLNEKITWNLNINTMSMRKELKISNTDIINNPILKKFLNVPYDLRNEAIEHAVRAYKSSTAAIINRNIKSFELKEKQFSSFQNYQIELPFHFLDVSINKIELCKTNINKHYKEKINCKLALKQSDLKLINDKFKNDEFNIRLYRTKAHKYYLILTRNIVKEINDNRNNIVSLDPGVRTFQTCYDPSGLIIESGTDIKDDIHKIYKKINKYTSISNNKKNNHKRRRKYRIMKIKKYEKIKNIVDNMHNQLASYLTKNYKTIIAPQLEVKKLVATTEVNTSGETVEKPRVLSSANSRFMNTFAFYRFHEKLKSLSALRNCKLYIVNEAYTSKTCGICGSLNNNLGGSKIFKCVNSECKVKLDRDYNGARNILLKHLI